jgi:transposase
MPPAYVKAYVKRNKNDAADAEAVTRPSMRFVPMKDADQQSVLMMHRARTLLVRQRTMPPPRGCPFRKARVRPPYADLLPFLPQERSRDARR